MAGKRRINAARRPPETESQGYMLASQGRTGLRTPARDRAWDDFNTLATDESRAAFADHWLGINADALDATWRMTYELLRVVRDTRLYERPIHGREQTFSSIEEYFEFYFGNGLASWMELEATYQFAHDYAPKLFGANYTDATTAKRILNNADKRALIADQLRETPERSATWIAHDLGVTDWLVFEVKRAMANATQITERSVITGRDGQSYPAHPREMRVRLAEALRATPEAQNRVIAEKVGCHPRTVGQLRHRMEQDGDIPATPRRVDNNGLTRTVTQPRMVDPRDIRIVEQAELRKQTPAVDGVTAPPVPQRFSTRDPSRIAVMVDKLARVWQRHPDWRLGQLLMNVLSRTRLDLDCLLDVEASVWMVEDDQLEAGLDALEGSSA